MMKVMIVDDNPKIRETIRVCITPLVEQIIECGDGSEVRDSYMQNRPDLVLMDIQMQKMDGVTAAKNLHDEFPQSRIIFVSEFFDAKHKKMVEDAGALGLISKENLLELNTVILKTIDNDFNNFIKKIF